jgi:hypothetical protein
MELQGLLSRSQECSICRYPEPYKSIPYHPSPSLYDQF